MIVFNRVQDVKPVEGDFVLVWRQSKNKYTQFQVVRWNDVFDGIYTHWHKLNLPDDRGEDYE